jgi:hypothetical protein
VLSGFNKAWDIKNLVEISDTKFYESPISSSPFVPRVVKLIGKFCKAATPIDPTLAALPED